MAKKPIPTKTLPAQTTRVAQIPESEMPYAVIRFAANNSVLYPIDAIDGTTATLTLAPGATNVIFYMSLKGQDEPAFEPVHVPNGVDVVEISAQSISRCIGHTVLIKYTATVGGRALESLTLELEVQQVREEHLVVSRPVFEHARNEWNTWYLRMSEFSGDETVLVKAWPMIEPGQRLFIAVAGNQHIVPYRFIWVALDHVVQAHEANAEHVFKFSLSRGWLSTLESYSAITIHLGVIWSTAKPVYPDPGEPHLENPLPKNAQDFHLRTTSLLVVDSTRVLSPADMRESVEQPAGQWQLNPINTVKGGHAIVRYDGMYEGDHVCVYASGPDIGRVPLGCKDVKAGETSLSFDIVPAIIAGSFNNSLTLDYTLQFNDYVPQTSPERVVKVLAPTLTKPCIEQATGNTLALTTFEGDATAWVPAWDYAAVGQCVWAWITGTLADGSPYLLSLLMGEPLTADWLTHGVDAAIPRAELQKLEDCSEFELHAAVSFDGKCDLATAIEFQVETFNIDQEALELNAPTVCEAVGNQLTIYNGRDGVTVRVAYPSMSNKHQIQLNWKRLDGTYVPLDPKAGDSAQGYVEFAIDRVEVIHGSGQTITINYTVTSACKRQTSDDLDLEISVPVRLERPVVPQATPPAVQNGVLDLRSFDGGAHVDVPQWWFMLVGQRGWLTCTGIQEDGTELVIKVMDAEVITAEDLADGLSRVLLREVLANYKNQTELTVEFRMTVDGHTDVARAIVFPSLMLTFRKHLIDETDFDPAGKGWNGWERGLGAANPGDLELRYGSHGIWSGYWLRDWSHTNTQDPATESEKLFKIFKNLEVGRHYQLLALVCNDNNRGILPQMALSLNGADLTGVLIPDLDWELLAGTFKATSNTARLSVDNRQLGNQLGNDFRLTWLRLYEV